jgi:hypothetical protein
MGTFKKGKTSSDLLRVHPTGSQDAPIHSLAQRTYSIKSWRVNSLIYANERQNAPVPRLIDNQTTAPEGGRID